MLIVNTFAASVSEERRRLHNMVCNRNGDCGRQKRGAEERQYLTPMQYGGAEEERRGNANEMQRGWHPTGKVLGNVVGGIVGKLRGGENLMQNGPGGEGEEERRCFQGWDPKTTGCDPHNMRRGGNENLMQNGKRGGNENLMQNGKREGGENMMQNGKREGGEEERQCGVTMDCNYGDEEEEKRQGQTNEMQNGGEAEDERRSNINEMQNGGEAEEERRSNINEMQNGGEGEEERRGNANEMQRGWHPTGKVLGNVVGGIVGKLRGGENLMQ